MSHWYECLIHRGEDLSYDEKVARNAKLSGLVKKHLSVMKPGKTFYSSHFVGSLDEDFIREFNDLQHLLKAISATMRHAVKRGDFSGSNGQYTKNRVTTPPSQIIGAKKRIDYMVALIDDCMCRGIFQIDAIQSKVHKNICKSYTSETALRHSIIEIRSRVLVGDVGGGREVLFEPIDIPKSLASAFFDEVQAIIDEEIKELRVAACKKGTDCENDDGPQM